MNGAIEIDVVALYEHPLPVLDINVEKIKAEAAGNVSGGFVIKNKGGGNLSGKILSNSKAVTFSPREFTGRNIKVDYFINLAQYKSGDELRTSAVIMSNGGEKTLPVFVKVIPARIVTKEEIDLASLSDFAEYSVKYPLSARQLFMSVEFENWLSVSNNPHMDSYSEFIKDADKERALDNFFIISGLKKKSKALPQAKRITATVNPFEKLPYTGDIRLVRDGWGHLDCEVSLLNGAKWLKMGRDRINGRDFDVNGQASLSFYISPVFLTSPVCRETVMIGGEHIDICARTLPPLTVKTPRSSFGFNDNGKLLLYNNTGRDLTIEILPEDNYLKLEGRLFFIGKYAEIPFEVRLGALQVSRLRLTKQPAISTGIHISASEEFIKYKKRIEINIGEINIEKRIYEQTSG